MPTTGSLRPSTLMIQSNGVSMSHGIGHITKKGFDAKLLTKQVTQSLDAYLRGVVVPHSNKIPSLFSGNGLGWLTNLTREKGITPLSDRIQKIAISPTRY